MILSLAELLDIVIMTFAIGFIFSRYYRKEPVEEDPIKFYATQNTIFHQIMYGAMIAAPAVVLHELAHKFVAMSFGATAILHAPYFMYALAILMVIMNFPFFFLVGGYVTHTALPPLPSAFVAIAGPLMNIFLWLIFKALFTYKIVPKKYWKELVMMSKLNLFLGIFNMLPIPGFDGFNFYISIFNAFF
jgi:Zn-dependent protease